ncbi:MULTISPECIES: alpha/beta hydrolase [Sphingomonas]|uniref:alpha/beta hydrolase n=1 Tax=Sphingomonas TaxID=13687 RepID=UPI00082EE953|nr:MULTISPECIES: alpha/beta hydrolase [Sphingomonas]MBY0300681.1 alpha/beta hydrolase [Sphingomonas ginsenosidimutans]
MDRRRHPPGLTFTDWHAADGWALRRYDWAPAPDIAPRGPLLFLGGRGDFAEKYLEAMAHWRARGWHVTGIDWRGQGGSGRLLADPLVNHLTTLDPLLDDLAAFAAAVAPRVAVAHSMGAHLLLRWLAERDGTLDAAVLSSPMLGLRAGPLGTAPLALTARAACALGRGERRIWEGDAGNVGGRMTSCPDRQADKLWWKANVPAIASGAPSWGWMRAACASIAALDRAPLGRVATPLLMLVSRRDPVVSPAAIARIARRLPAATLHLLPGQGHELLREGDAIRREVLARIDAHWGR